MWVVLGFLAFIAVLAYAWQQTPTRTTREIQRDRQMQRDITGHMRQQLPAADTRDTSRERDERPPG